jgi:hypothetical protein
VHWKDLRDKFHSPVAQGSLLAGHAVWAERWRGNHCHHLAWAVTSQRPHKCARGRECTLDIRFCDSLHTIIFLRIAAFMEFVHRLLVPVIAGSFFLGKKQCRYLLPFTWRRNRCSCPSEIFYSYLEFRTSECRNTVILSAIHRFSWSRYLGWYWNFFFVQNPVFQWTSVVPTANNSCNELIAFTIWRVKYACSCRMIPHTAETLSCAVRNQNQYTAHSVPGYFNWIGPI